MKAKDIQPGDILNGRVVVSNEKVEKGRHQIKCKGQRRGLVLRASTNVDAELGKNHQFSGQGFA